MVGPTVPLGSVTGSVYVLAQHDGEDGRKEAKGAEGGGNGLLPRVAPPPAGEDT